MELAEFLGREGEYVLFDQGTCGEHLHAVVAPQATSSNHFEFAKPERSVLNTSIFGSSRISESAVRVPYRSHVWAHGERSPIPVWNGDATIHLLKKVFVLEQKVSIPGEELADGGVGILRQSVKRSFVLIHESFVLWPIPSICGDSENCLNVAMTFVSGERCKVVTYATAIDENASSTSAPSPAVIVYCGSFLAGWGREE